MNTSDGLNGEVRPFGAASLWFVAGQGWVLVPHLFRVTLRTMAGTGIYEVQTFNGPGKAVALASEVHAARVGGPDTITEEVEDLGPTQPGGVMDAIDDRAEW
jgi:hypothetical protein